MSFEKSSQNDSSVEQAKDKMPEKRILNDSELIKGGAQIEEEVLRPTKEQVDEANLEMRKEKGEFSGQEEQRIIEIRDRLKNNDELYKNLDLMELIDLKSRNAEEFNKIFNPEATWNITKETFRVFSVLNEKESSSIVRVAAYLKELFSDERTTNLVSPEILQKSVQECNKTLKSKFSAGIFLFGKENQVTKVVMEAANIKVLDPEAFARIQITPEVVKVAQDSLRKAGPESFFSKTLSRALRIIGSTG